MHGPPWIWRKGCRRGRPPKGRWIWGSIPRVSFIPVDENGVELPGEPIVLTPDEVEALRLVYLEDLTQDEAAAKMGVSRGTLWRTVESARKKLVQALVEKRPIIIIKVS
ncbi:DUF134 domain-containing protein [Infirmifilum lucidum]|uniref:DUF134 domain-containing protein n=1 Tax=Infirmifilum lucidum TaxID=2776706 RepID=A0A7L9FHV4_9CREN|nr:DUF134 domain-containing protein [Infirmifilum lucidum]QOJ79339.1 DUF134 domain-containing protein [Infirmifilum lucidum]